MDTTSSPYPVYIGVWTNWSYGRVFGSTLTLTKEDGALLIAFLAFFVALVGTHIWRIICFVLFKILSNPTPQDALYGQRQAILRNYASPLGTAWALVQMLHAWATPAARNGRCKPFARILPLLFTTIIIALALTAASGFSSQLARGNEVLIHSPRCGIIRQDAFTNQLNFLTLYSPYRRRQREQAAEYAQRCYESNAGSESCSTFMRAALPVAVTSNASCPFEESLCISKDSNVIVEAGPIDSLADLGLNWPDPARFQLYHRMHCAPLVTLGFRTRYVSGNDTYTRYQYGDQSTPPSDCNCTVAVNEALTTRVTLDEEGSFFQPFQDYSVISIWAQFSHGLFVPDWSLFTPISGLQKHKGDLSLTFLFSNEIMFTEKSEDDWYRATVPLERGYSSPPGQGEDTIITLYAAEEPAWPMGCVEQFQICKQDYCTGWGSRNDTVRGIYRNTDMASKFLGLASFIDLMVHPSNMITALGKDSLASRYKAADGMQVTAREREWHLDVVHWVSAILAALQSQIVEIASGPAIDNPELEDYITRPNETEYKQYCGSQKIRSAAYTSFGMFGLLCVLFSGSIIIVTSATIETVADLVQKWVLHRPSSYSRFEWRANHALHLHRLAHVEIDDWNLSRWDLPITSWKSSLAILDTSDEVGLPRFMKVASDGPVDAETMNDASFRHGPTSGNASPGYDPTDFEVATNGTNVTISSLSNDEGPNQVDKIRDSNRTDLGNHVYVVAENPNRSTQSGISDGNISSYS